MKSKQIIKGWLGYLYPHWRKILFGSVLLIITSGLSIIAPVFIKYIIDLGIMGRDVSILMNSTISYFLIYILSFYLSFRVSILMEGVGQDIMVRLKSDAFLSILKKKVDFFSDNPEGKLISRVENDGESVRQLFSANTIRLVADVLLLIGMLLVMFLINARLFLYLLVSVVPLLIVLVYVYSRLSRPRWLKFRKVVADLSSYVVEYFKGMELVKSFDRIGFIKKSLTALDGRYLKTGFHAEVLNIVFFNIITFIQILGFSVVLWFGGKMVASGAATMGTLVLFITYIRQFFEPIMSLSFQLSFIEKAKASSQRLFELNVEDNRHEYLGTKVKDFCSNIEFKSVDFSYDHEKSVLNNIDLTIEKGQRVALVGRTGGGKSTIIKLILKLIKPDEGKIFIDGVDLFEMDTVLWRKKVGYISQNIFLFPGKLIDNLRMFDEGISGDDIMQTVDLLGLNPLFAQFPDGLDTQVSEGGKNFSRGEQQLLNIVRAVTGNPELLIMDEATSTIDAKYERQIVEALRRISKDTTMISVAHRISTINDADK
ncbi:ABC transporter ATP-binding protein, partial [bacterium]|nr:ABC transporter ATP-binding protein [bacterium]